MQNKAATYLQIDTNALRYNYRYFKSKLKDNTNIIAVVKAFAYGHEAGAIAKILETEQPAYFAVAFAKEGVALRQAGITTPILLLHPQECDTQVCLDYRIEPAIYSFRILDIFYKAVKKRSLDYSPIHLKFNTGLNRLGFKPDDAKKLLSTINKDKTLKITSVFSHLVASEDPNERIFTLKQIDSFNRIVIFFEKNLEYTFLKHITNTSGTLNYPEVHFDMVRIGIGLYGYANEKSKTKHLKNVASLYSVISQIHLVSTGESIGYNRGFIADKNTKSATIPIGHADGIPRTWGKGVGFVYINGKKAPILGNVCMDMIMVDVSDIDCVEGDKVVVFESQQQLIDLARKTGTISYEILTALSQRLERRII